MAMGGRTMIFIPISLEDDPACDHEVDSSDAIDVDLAFQADAEQMEPESDEGFESAVGIRSGQVDEPPSCAGQCGTDPSASRVGKSSRTPR
jgi:hypothetical protein